MAKFYQFTGAKGEPLFIDPEKVDYVKEVERDDEVNGAYTEVIICVNGRELEIGESLEYVQDVFAGESGVAEFETK